MPPESSLSPPFLQRAPADDEARLRGLYERLSRKGRLLVVVDQPATIEALTVAVTQDMGVAAGYLPGLPMGKPLGPGSGERQDRQA